MGSSESTLPLAATVPQRSERLGFASVFLIWLSALAIIHSGLVLLEAPPPSTDVFLFKEAGANLALKGRFVARNLPNQAYGEENIFSYYPPIYPLLFGVWSRVLGLGLAQSLSFDSLIRMVRTALLLWLLVGPGSAVADSKQTRRIPIALLTILGIFSFFSTDSDRPDDLAVCWGLLAWGTLFSEAKPYRKPLAGLLFGLCAGTSPTAACYFTGIGLFYLAFFKKDTHRWRQAFWVGAISVATFALINAPIYWSDPQSYLRFSRQIPLSTFPYLAPLREGQPLVAAYYKMRPMFTGWFAIAWPHLTLVFVLVLAFLFIKNGKRARFSRTIGFLSIAFVPICFLVWTLQPFYLWFSAIGLLFAISDGLCEMQPSFKKQISLVLTAAAMLPLMAVMFKVYVAAFERPDSDSANDARKRVLSWVGSQSNLAVTPDQYFTFRAMRELANVYYVCETLTHFDFVYVTRHQSRSILAAEPTPIPCEKPPTCFKPVEDLSNHKRFHLLGWELPYYIGGNGGVLYENLCSR